MAEKIVLIPIPQKIVSGKGTFIPSGRLLNAIISRNSIQSKIPGVVYQDSASLFKDKTEGYMLDINPKGIVITSLTDSGWFYANITLRQIARQFGKSGFPYVKIEDWPDLPARGFMLDISRDKVPTMETLFGIVDRLAEFKMNQFQLYTEHTFAYKKHKSVWAKASPMTATEIRRLDAYCRDRHIELVPNQNSFGHMERWLKHPAYKDLAEAPDGFIDFWGNRRDYAFSLNPTDTRVLKFLEGLYNELLPNFRSSLFNVGCDETFDLGQGKSKALCEKIGLSRVYLDFILKIYRMIKKRGHVMQFWGDIIMRHPELIPEIPKDIIALNWGYEAQHPFDKECKAFSDAGVLFYVCPGTSSWNSIAGRWENARENLLNAAQNGIKHGAIGFLVTDWGDNGHFQQLPVSYPGIAYGAALSWSFDANRKLDIVNSLSTHLFMDASGKMARSLVMLGNAYLETGVKISNASILSKVLLEPYEPGGAAQIEKLKLEKLKATEAKIKKAIAILEESTSKSKECECYTKEILFTADLLLFACRIAMIRITAKEKKILNIPDKAVNPLIKDLKDLVERYKKLWLVRNRKGGLHDSINRLDKLKKLYSK